MKQHASRKRESGLTLLEVVVATAIFSVTVATLLVVRERAIDQTGRAKNYRTARRLSMQLLEEVLGGKKFDEGDSGPFDRENYPGFFWHIKRIEKMELNESELPFLQKPEGKGPGAGGAGDGGAPGAPPGGAPPGGALAALLGGAGGAGGMADELFRYLVEVAYPAPTDSGVKKFEVVTYYLKETDSEAMAKAMGGALGGKGKGGASPQGGLGGLLGGGR